MRTRLLPLSLLLLALLVGPTAASAAYDDAMLEVDGTVSSPDACKLPSAPTAAGIARSSWSSPADGYLSVRLYGGLEGDWDLAVFGEGAQALAASSSFGSNEIATLWVDEGDQLTAQACRIEGSKSIRLAFELTEYDLDAAARPERVSLERVPLTSAEEVVPRLEAAGFDVTHAVTSDSAVVVTYSDAERAELARRFGIAETVDPDLSATNRQSRREEQQASLAGVASALPSERTEYRQYVDYTDDLKELADTYPDLVEPVVVGSTFEGRTIEGVELASDVGKAGDGRPVYLNMGAHHAREWPSAEFPMEWAISLAEDYGTDPRVTALLDSVRVVIIPVVNVDGFIASRSFGTSPLDDDQIATLALSVAGIGAYIRKNCRPTTPADMVIPCPARVGSGVDTNRNYGAYWGGAGASTDTTSQGYRGEGPFSEPETQAMREYMSTLPAIINITNHTFTEEGQWLRQPGFEDDPITDPDGDGIHETPDEHVHAEIGDAMALSTGWESNKSTILGSITGATEDWNYYVQSAYGFTPEGRGPNFHGTYADAVVTEFEGDDDHPGQGVRDAFLRAGEIVADPAVHSVIEGPAPAGALLTLERTIVTPTNDGPGTISDDLRVTLTVDETDSYEWHVGPSSPPLVSGVNYTMTCTRPGGTTFTTEVGVDRGEVETVDWLTDDACGAAAPDPDPDPDPDPYPEPDPSGKKTCRGLEVTIRGTNKGETIRGTKGDDVIVARGGKDLIRGGGGNDTICSGAGKDEARGGKGDDRIAGGAGKDLVRGGAGDDRLNGGKGVDELRGGAGDDRCRVNKPRKGEKTRGCES